MVSLLPMGRMRVVLDVALASGSPTALSHPSLTRSPAPRRSLPWPHSQPTPTASPLIGEAVGGEAISSGPATYWPCLMPGSPALYSMGWVASRPGMLACLRISPTGRTTRPKLALSIIALPV